MLEAINKTINDKEKIKSIIKNKIEKVLIKNKWYRENNTNRSPSVIFRNIDKDFEYYLDNLVYKAKEDDEWVSSTTYFCYDFDKELFVGVVNIRHRLNEFLLNIGGHIGDGIRPEERKRGYTTAIWSM